MIKNVKKIFYAVALLTIFLDIGIKLYGESTVPAIQGNINMPGLESPVNVYHDKNGIPHIIGKSDRDTYKVMGYVFAGKRLFQMDLLRRVVSGRLSEIFGDKTIQADIMLRKIGFKKSAQEMIKLNKDKIDDKVFLIMDAFIDGIEHFVQTESLPLEFGILGYRPEKFTRADILGISGYMALTFAEGMTGDVLFYDLADELDAVRLDAMRIGAKADSNLFSRNVITTKINSSQASQAIDKKVYKNLFSAIDQIASVVPLFHGSNSWVLSPKRSKSGSAILANDPHIAYSNPSVFIEAHVKTDNIDLYGHFMPLVPFSIMGHTPHNAWGITMSEHDDLDVYIEKINPLNHKQVMYKNKWVELKEEIEIIKVKGQKDIITHRILTPHGPMIDGTKFGLKGSDLSISWMPLEKDQNVLMSLYLMPFAKTVEQFKTAVSYATGPGLNMSYINKQGDIAWWVLGRIPKHRPGVRTDIALPGHDGSHEPMGHLSIDEHPHQVNPPSGMIITANYKPQLEKYADIDGYWQPGERYFRIQDLLNKQVKWSADEIKKIQYDNVVPLGEVFNTVYLGLMDEKELNPIELEAFFTFRKWKGESGKKSVGSSILHMWNAKIFRNIYIDEIGEERYEAFARTADFWHCFNYLIKNPNHVWWDNISSKAKVETAKDILLLSYQQAILELQKEYGYNIKKWNWGRLHTVEYNHALGSQWPLNYLFNIGPYPAPGGRYQINNMGHRKHTSDFRAVHGPATRRIIDMQNPLISKGILPTGISGNPFSPFFDNQVHSYIDGVYRDQIMDMKLIKKMKNKLIFTTK